MPGWKAHLVCWWKKQVDQGSLLYTPEHCLVNGGFPLCWWKKHMFQMVAKWRSFKEPFQKMLKPREMGKADPPKGLGAQVLWGDDIPSRTHQDTHLSC